jgi:hypothetical protein
MPLDCAWRARASAHHGHTAPHSCWARAADRRTIAADRDLGIGLGDLAEVRADVAFARVRTDRFREHANVGLKLGRLGPMSPVVKT